VSGAGDQLKRTIATAGDLQVVVRSMKAVAAASIVRYERAVNALALTDETVQRGLSACLGQLGSGSVPRVAQPLAPAPRRLGVVVIGSDQGLVGRFNERVLEAGEPLFAGRHGVLTQLWTIGERMTSALQDRGLACTALEVPATVTGIARLAGAVLAAIATAQTVQGLTAVMVLANRPAPGPGAGYAPATQDLLPLDDAWLRGLAARPWPRAVRPDLLAPALPTMQALLGEYLFVRVCRACAESLASEQASRLAAMQRADRTIDTLLAGLRLRFQRQRQEAIDEELFDVIAGSEALHPPS